MKKTFIMTMIAAAMTVPLMAQEQAGRIPVKGFAVYEASGHFQPYEFIRHAVGDHDIQVEILYARICHHVFADWVLK